MTFRSRGCYQESSLCAYNMLDLPSLIIYLLFAITLLRDQNRSFFPVPVKGINQGSVSSDLPTMSLNHDVLYEFDM